MTATIKNVASSLASQMEGLRSRSRDGEGTQDGVALVDITYSTCDVL